MDSAVNTCQDTYSTKEIDELYGENITATQLVLIMPNPFDFGRKDDKISS